MSEGNSLVVRSRNYVGKFTKEIMGAASLEMLAARNSFMSAQDGVVWTEKAPANKRKNWPSLSGRLLNFNMIETLSGEESPRERREELPREEGPEVASTAGGPAPQEERACLQSPQEMGRDLISPIPRGCKNTENLL